MQRFRLDSEEMQLKAVAVVQAVGQQCGFSSSGSISRFVRGGLGGDVDGDGCQCGGSMRCEVRSCILPITAGARCCLSSLIRGATCYLNPGLLAVD
jgi:hypothetical protein